MLAVPRTAGGECPGVVGPRTRPAPLPALLEGVPVKCSAHPPCPDAPSTFIRLTIQGFTFDVPFCRGHSDALDLAIRYLEHTRFSTDGEVCWRREPIATEERRP
jgi:hypothetical protein